jgi:hypothetical protein
VTAKEREKVHARIIRDLNKLPKGICSFDVVVFSLVVSEIDRERRRLSDERRKARKSAPKGSRC